MAMHLRPRALKVDLPTFEPDAAMLDRLVALSARSTPSPGPSRSVGMRVAFVVTVVASLGATTWAAGAIPGVDTPFPHRVIEHAPLVPTSPAEGVGSPQSDASGSGSPAAAGLPDDQGSAGHGRSDRDRVHHVVLPQGIVLPAASPGDVPPGQAKKDRTDRRPKSDAERRRDHGPKDGRGHARSRHHGHRGHHQR